MLQHDLLGEYVDKNGFNFTSELLARENLTCFVTGWLCIYIEDCDGWWLSGCHGSVAEHSLVAQARGVLGLTPGECRSGLG